MTNHQIFDKHTRVNKIEYLFYLSPQSKDRLRVEFHKEKNEIRHFCVQYECNIDKWYPVVRYDTSHGFAHKDLLHPDGSSEKQPLPFLTYNLALIHATQDLKQNWQRYRHFFEEEINDRK